MSINRACIIGGKGAMGSFFKHIMQQKNINVRILDKPMTEAELKQSLPVSEYVLLCVPTQNLEEALLQIADYLSETCILSDISSIKLKAIKLMLKHHSGPVVGTHPLFGPEPDLKTPCKIALVFGRSQQALVRVKQLMLNLGLSPFLTSAKEHDQAMAYVQGLNFVTTVSYLASVSNNSTLEHFLTPSFYRRLTSARKMLTQDSELFRHIFETNPFSLEAVEQFRHFLDLAAKGDLDSLLEKSNWWWCMKNFQGGS